VNVIRKILGILTTMGLLGLLIPGCTMIPLSIEIKTPEDGAEYYVNVLKVTSAASNSKATVTVNGVEAKPVGNGEFYAYIELTEGQNDIEVVATLGQAKITKTVTVSFSPALAVYLDYPEPANEVDYSNTPLIVKGRVSDSGAQVVVNEIVAEVVEREFSVQVQLQEGNNTIEAVATLGEERDDSAYDIILNPEGQIISPPGGGGGTRYLSRILHDQSIQVEAGEQKTIDVALEVRKGIPDTTGFSYKLSMVIAEYDENIMPSLEGLGIYIEPTSFTAYPNTTYHSTITINTSHELAAGDYWLFLEGYYGDSKWAGVWIGLKIVN